MTFAFSAGGTVEETLASLHKLTPADLGNDGMGITTRDLIARAIETAGKLDEDGRQVYVARASGNHGSAGPVTLNIHIELGNRHTPE